MASDTIFALATGPGRTALAIIRLSGPQAGIALTALTAKALPPARVAKLVTLHDPDSLEPLDHGLVLWFPTPNSATGEDVAELHLHGGRAIIAAVTEALSRVPGLRPAEPGEFTRRAFDNGKLDLTEAEAVADLIDAETAAQRRQALCQYGGALGRLYEDWHGRLARLLAHLEAEIDFPDEDLPPGLDQRSRGLLELLLGELNSHLHDGHRGERVRNGLSIAIIGPPNAGKSSLLNLLARRDAAIVSARSGTTRDIIEIHLDLGGYPVILADTAGLRDSSDEIESEGIRRALERAATADLKIAVFDGACWPELDGATLGLLDQNTVPVLNKSDCHGQTAITIGGRPGFSLCSRTGDGLAPLLDRLITMVAERLDTAARPTLTRLRHRLALEECRDSLVRALSAPLPELTAEDVRLASRALGRITGRVAVDDLLDIIFRDFCIGK
ncbi:MAG: tRNA uridine-5-carboxymethylaminomethyl(34) synthesis GTPase MnmE [Rhodospirillaceae bacterium]